MYKTSIKRKEVYKFIKARLAEGMKRTDILTDLNQRYYDKVTLCKMIAAVPEMATIKKYRNWNNMLLGLLIFTIVIKIIIGVLLVSGISWYLMPLATIFAIITVLFTLKVAKFRGYIYNLLGLFAIANMFKLISDLESTGIWGHLDLAIGASIAALAFFLGHKMFPHYGLFGPKKDEDGKLMLGPDL
jgi:hypothetical protein